MRNWLNWVVFCLLAVVSLTTNALAFEPGELIQWGQEQKLRVEFGERYIFWNTQPAQLGIPRESPSALSQMDIKIQYRVWENTDLGKVECYLGPSFLTHWDIPDRLNFAIECGYTFWEKFRLEVGYLYLLNIGRDTPHAGHYFVGTSALLIKRKDWEVNWYVRYYLNATVPAKITQTGSSGADPLGAETGVHVQYQVGKYAYLFAAPYVLASTSFSLDRIGSYGGIRYDAGKHIGFLENVSLELAGNYGTNLSSPHMEETQAWIKLIWKFE